MIRTSARAATMVVVLVVVAALTACAPQRDSSDGLTKLGNIGQPLNSPLPSAVRAAHLIDSTGTQRTLGELKGKIVVMSDTMTLCQETCPLDTAALVQTARKVEAAGLGKKVIFVSLTVDPERDNPAQLAAYRRQFAPIPANWMLLTGGPSAVHGILKSLGVYWKKVPQDSANVRNWRTGAPLTFDIEHSDEVFFIDGAGQERFLLEGPPQVDSTGQVPKQLQAFMTRKGRENLHDPDPTDWTVSHALTVLSTMTGKALR